MTRTPPTNPDSAPGAKPSEKMTDRQEYNVVTDLAAGPNIRVKDNVLQGLAILVCAIIGAVIGLLVIRDKAAGALVGGFIGVVAGLFLSGLFLMIYRAVMHARGKHD